MHDVHDHSHDHGHGAGHSHSHSHEHSHEHTHSHGQAGDETLAPVAAMMGYLLDHNRSHAGELGQIAEKLKANGKDEAARILAEGVSDFARGNEKLEKALELINK